VNDKPWGIKVTPRRQRRRDSRKSDFSVFTNYETESNKIDEREKINELTITNRNVIEYPVSDEISGLCWNLGLKKNNNEGVRHKKEVEGNGCVRAKKEKKKRKMNLVNELENEERNWRE
jgi:hypothetical protein